MENVGKGTRRVGKGDWECQQGPGSVQPMCGQGSLLRR